ncbi:uncharacterized protein [Nicotiana tomentosiformis]|uniref:uncharacterized protein n=1 Tax=Nicotiana tomentosiformis TaxID=4098 RepID=UPI00388C94C2
MHQLLKDNLRKAQERMKYYADKRRTDREFQVGDMVCLKPQPYRQTSIALRKNSKQSFKYYGLYKMVGDKVVVQTAFPSTNKDGQFLVKPVAILQRKMVKKINATVVKMLVPWSNLQPEDATWEDYQFLKAKCSDSFPHS